MDWGGLSFVQRHFLPDSSKSGMARIDKEYKNYEASKRGRQGDQSDAPLLTGRASSPEQDSGATASDEWSWNKEKSQPKRSSSKPSGDWENWGEGWSETWNSSNPSSPLKGTSSSSENSSKKSSTAKSKKKTKESLLIDFEDEKSSDKDEWNSKWDDDEAWKMLNKHD